MQPFISIIVPNYNHHAYLKARIESILNQTYQHFELILMDDCSTDNSLEIIESYRSHPKVSQIILNEQNSGSTFLQWNKAVHVAKGAYVWLAESDDLAEPMLLETLIQPILKAESVVLSYCNSMRIDERTQEIGLWEYKRKRKSNTAFLHDFLQIGSDYVQDHLLWQNTIPNASAVLFKKDVYEKVGGADATIEKCGDWFLWLKMALNGTVAYNATALNKFRFHTTSVIGSSMQALRKGAFLNKYDIKMREAFATYLSASQLPNAAQIATLNKECIKSELREDLWYFIRKRRFDNAFKTYKILTANH